MRHPEVEIQKERKSFQGKIQGSIFKDQNYRREDNSKNGLLRGKFTPGGNSEKGEKALY